MNRILFKLLYICCLSIFFTHSFASKKDSTMSKKEEFWKAVFGDKTREEVDKELELFSKTVPITPTGKTLGHNEFTYLDPRYKKYKDRGIYGSQDPEAMYQRLERERLIKNIKIIASALIVIFLLVMLFRKRFGPSKIDKKIKAISKYDDNTLTEDEKQIAGVLYELKSKINDPELKDLIKSYGKDAIDEVSFEIFKYGMWRLLDKKYANHLFDNKGYVYAAKQKIIDDINKKLLEDDFLQMEKDGVQLFVLGWVLKTRDDAKNVRNIMYSLVSN